ncbi:hypothetical protein CC78DRAFT_579589 [Lojkania enalia]|uniref:Uncharacterized protein n=1 Tax=Lojkania enalia TaxID=147567 RepID=A0A9P4N4T4_9PLEO|nr:hypothetical protein CC78DRAFT_579589 [Didymosphaeria enalia]
MHGLAASFSPLVNGFMSALLEVRLHHSRVSRSPSTCALRPTFHAEALPSSSRSRPHGHRPWELASPVVQAITGKKPGFSSSAVGETNAMRHEGHCGCNMTAALWRYSTLLCRSCTQETGNTFWSEGYRTTQVTNFREYGSRYSSTVWFPSTDSSK